MQQHDLGSLLGHYYNRAGKVLLVDALQQLDLNCLARSGAIQPVNFFDMIVKHERVH